MDVPKVLVSFRLKDELVVGLKELADSYCCTKTRIIEDLLIEKLRQEGLEPALIKERMNGKV